MAAGKRDAVPARPIDVTDGWTADAALGTVPAPWDADRAVTVMFSEHYRSLVRMAALLVGDVATAEAVVQDSFVAMHGAWRRLRDSEKALPYLRQCLVNRSRSALRHRVVIGRHTQKREPDVPSIEREAPPLPQHAMAGALRALPLRQREALVLTFYGGLTEEQAASAMGISPGMVKNHKAQAVETLRVVLGAET